MTSSVDVRKLRRLDRLTRLRAYPSWLLPLLFALVALGGLLIHSEVLAVAYWMVLGIAVMSAMYRVFERSARTFDAGTPPVPMYLVNLGLVAAAVSVSLVASSLGWSLAAWLGAPLVVAAGQGHYAWQMHSRTLAMAPLIMVALAVGSYLATFEPGILLSIVAGLVVSAIVEGHRVSR